MSEFNVLSPILIYLKLLLKIYPYNANAMAKTKSPPASFIATGKRAVTKSAKAKALEADLAKVFLSFRVTIGGL
jgi:hypothetical protein